MPIRKLEFAREPPLSFFARAQACQQRSPCTPLLAPPPTPSTKIHRAQCQCTYKFFKKACSTTWLEGQEGIVRLPEVTSVTFQTYSTWLYTGQIADGPCTAASAFDEKQDEFQVLVDLYLLGDKLFDTQLRNQANIALFKSMQKANSIPDVHLTTLVWESTVSGSLLRKLFVDVLVWRFSREVYAGIISQYPAEYVQEVAIAALQAVSTLSWEQMAQKLSSYQEAEGTS